MKIILTLILTAFGLANAEPSRAWPEEPQAFRGLAFGASEHDARRIFGPLDCHTEKGPGWKVCYTDILILDIPVRVSLTFEHKKFVETDCSFPAAEFEAMKSLFFDHYGAGNTKNVSSDDGGDRFLWKGDLVLVELIQYGDNSRRFGLLHLATIQHDAVLQQMIRASIKNAL